MPIRQNTSCHTMRYLLLLTVALLLTVVRISAENIQFPADAGFNNVKDFGAVGNGTADDTKAFKDAIAATWPANDGGHPSNFKTLYVPNRTYLISDQLNWSRWSIWQGQSEAGTVIKLKDNCSGFGTGANKAFLRCYYNNNMTFDNHMANLTIDVGTGNPGAIGFKYSNHNGGLVQYVTIKSEDGQGTIGLDMTENEFGPSMLKNITIDGFDKGIVTVGSVSHATFYNITLKNQKTVGLENNLPISIYGLTSTNTCMAIKNNSFWMAHVVLIKAVLNGGNGGPAIDNSGFAYLRDISTSGYAQALEDHGTALAGMSIAEWYNADTLSVFNSPKKHIGLPFIEVPPTFYEPIANWKTPSTSGDMTQNIQAAMNSGASTIYFKFGQNYGVEKTITVPATVKRIVGMYNSPGGNSGELADKNKPVLRIEGTTTEPLVIERVPVSRWPHMDAVSFEVASNRPVVIWSAGSSGTIRTTAGLGGNLWLMDCHGDFRFNGPKNVYVMHWNPENNPFPRPIRTYCINDGANFWMLGIKTEAPSIHVDTRNGGFSEILGGFFRDHMLPDNGDTVPFFKTTNASLSATYLAYDWSAGGNSRGLQAIETRNGQTKQLKLSASSHVVGLYSAWDGVTGISSKPHSPSINPKNPELKVKGNTLVASDVDRLSGLRVLSLQGRVEAVGKGALSLNGLAAGRLIAAAKGAKGSTASRVLITITH